MVIQLKYTSQTVIAQQYAKSISINITDKYIYNTEAKQCCDIVSYNMIFQYNTWYNKSHTS